MLGGLFLGLAEVLSIAYIGSDMRDAVAFGFLFLVLLLRPRGLFWFNPGAQGLMEAFDNFLGRLQQPGAHAGHQRAAGVVHLPHAVLRHASRWPTRPSWASAPTPRHC